MLILTRKVDETVQAIVPPSDKPVTIEMTVTGIRGPLVKLGFVAPQSVRFARGELVDKERRPNQRG